MQNKTYIYILKILRALWLKAFERKTTSYITVAESPIDADRTSSLISDAINEGRPFMVARYGAFELSTLINYLSVTSANHSIWKYIKGELSPFWWNESILNKMETNAGFFPATHENAIRFSELMLEDTKHLDILAEWKTSYHRIENLLPANVQMSHLSCVEPFFAKHPWTKALEGKKVLVVHPFDELIRYQYNTNRTVLFSNKELLPDFQLITLKAVQSIGGQNNGFKDWFEALDWMKHEIDKTDYDVCLIGCGAYGFPLAAHCKRQGKQAIHLGGSLQLLFGIIGKRWEDVDYGVNEWKISKGQYSSLINEYWLRPGQKERPKNANQVEGACYW